MQDQLTQAFEGAIRCLVIERHQVEVSTAKHAERKMKAEADLAELSLAHAKDMIKRDQAGEEVFDLPGLGRSS